MTVLTDPEGTERRYLLRYLTPASGTRVLELGCGDGRLTWRYARSAGMAVGMDLYPDDLRIARADCPVDLVERVHFIRADAWRLPLRKASFDRAIFAWSF